MNLSLADIDSTTARAPRCRRDAPGRRRPQRIGEGSHRCGEGQVKGSRLEEQRGQDVTADPGREERRRIRRRRRVRLKAALLGRSRGGQTSKVHLDADRKCRPLAFVLTVGQAADSPQFIPVLKKLRVRGPVGRPRTRPDAVAGDKAYSSRQKRILPAHPPQPRRDTTADHPPHRPPTRPRRPHPALVGLAPEDDNTRPAPTTTNDADTAPDLAGSHGTHRCSTRWFRWNQLIAGPGVPLTDAQRARIEPLLLDRTPKRGGRRRDHREVIDVIALKVQAGTPVGSFAGEVQQRARYPQPAADAGRRWRLGAGVHRPGGPGRRGRGRELGRSVEPIRASGFGGFHDRAGSPARDLGPRKRAPPTSRTTVPSARPTAD